MTPLVRRYIKTGFGFLIAGLALGGYIVVMQFALGVYPPRIFITAHTHLLLVGFVLMLVMGVATWMFPRPARDDVHYRAGLATAVYWITTIATIIRALGEILFGVTAMPAFRAAIVLGALGQLTGAALFVVNMWTRVRMPFASPPSR
jgi:heme/copper-type cytochrome/quinol oxidase subunit 1